MQSQRTPWKIGQLFIAINEIIIEEIILYYIRRTNITNVIIHQGRIGKSESMKLNVDRELISLRRLKSSLRFLFQNHLKTEVLFE